MNDLTNSDLSLLEALIRLPIEFPKVAQTVFIAVVWPILVAVFTLVAILDGYTKIHRWMYEPTANELHKQALKLLQKPRRPGGDTTVQVEKLLLEAISKDTTYTPATYSLAAFYIYRKNDPNSALRVLEDNPSSGDRMNHRYSSRLDTSILANDAKAMLNGNMQMIQKTMREDDFLSPIYADTARLAFQKKDKESISTN